MIRKHPEFLPCQNVSEISEPKGEIMFRWYNYKLGRDEDFSTFPPDNLLSDYIPQSEEAQELFWSYVKGGMPLVFAFCETLIAMTEDISIEESQDKNDLE